jgi:hypothetical protein
MTLNLRIWVFRKNRRLCLKWTIQLVFYKEGDILNLDFLGIELQDSSTGTGHNCLISNHSLRHTACSCCFLTVDYTPESTMQLALVVSEDQIRCRTGVETMPGTQGHGLASGQHHPMSPVLYQGCPTESASKHSLIVSGVAHPGSTKIVTVRLIAHDLASSSCGRSTSIKSNAVDSSSHRNVNQT